MTMKIAVVTPLMKSGERGGAESLYEGLVEALRRSSHDAEQVPLVIDESHFDAILDSYARCAELDLSGYDAVVSTKAPTYMVRHPNHVSYLLHTIRVFYDMFEWEFGEGNAALRRQRRIVHELDRSGLHPDRVRGHFANGRTTYERLLDADPFWRSVRFRALHHPPALGGFREPAAGRYVFLPSRLHRWKRADLVVEAFRHLDRDVALKICGTGEDEPALRELAAGDPRVEFLGRVDDARVLDLYAHALVVPFVPRQEDYGLVTVEAFHSGKPVITCRDSGEPTYLVTDRVNGFVVDPDPRAIAARLEYLVDHPDEAAEMGRRGRACVRGITWDRVVSGLLSAVAPERSRGPGGPAGPGYDEPYRARTCVLDMQPVDPPLGGGRIRLLGLYHGLGDLLPTTYVGTYDWPGESYRRHRLSDTLEEVDVPLTPAHFAAADAWKARAGGKNVIDVAFDRLAHHSPAFVETARAAAAGSDVVVFSHPWVYPLVKDLLRRDVQLVVYDAQNVEGLLRVALLDDGGFGAELARHVVEVEHELCHEADLVLCCSHEDRLLFHELYGVDPDRLLVVPNGTFTRGVAPPDGEARRAAKRALGLGGRPLAVFLGSGYAPNVEAAEYIRDVLAPALPVVQFALCGGVGDLLGPPRDGRPVPGNVRVTGMISEDEKRAYLAAADLALNPMRSGSGTNVKMFDFMAVGLPVVATPVGARGVAQGTEPAFAVAPLDEFAGEVRRVLGDPARSRALGEAGRRLCEERFSWERISGQLGRVLHRTWRRHGQPRPAFSVLCATYERQDRLPEMLACLEAQSLRNFEVVLVDQSAAPWDGAGRFPGLDLVYIHTDVKGAVKARNTAAFHARGRVLAFTDDDCQPLPDWLENAARYFHDPQVIGVEGLILSDKRDDPDFRAVTNQGFEGIGFMTANLFLRRETFLSIDGFDERFDNPHFREDTDLGWRALERGKIPFGHDVRVYHPPQPRSVEREGHAHRNRFFEKDALLFQKHPDRYRELFLQEAHYRHTPGFRDHFLRGAEKYSVEIDTFFIERLRQA
jgi:glycosyltransferase involved in cell wall biosynthesis/GT2 family glycosyltransferase